ncbi:uncharacterized protein LOC112351534 [Selaginella moellendorffii]|uniref:uncharacterized protein LOC112351534 n=1 Tax=Selaginella moellendorffii TaxID=88036 RepID=UPI000D1C4A57|nr:uncharacterized protein LOC112351534 [Selaginella moellendorffii]XP_024545365.1 uncharacterized protein LOC112351534 [Selaginella moellendorffii]|eukprot:XP_024545363.1 uncharacterized protein LOC112351534 [Selaginella moellendorffii]
MVWSCSSLPGHANVGSGKRSTVVSLEQQLEFARKGHVCIRRLFSSAEIKLLRQRIQVQICKEEEMLAAYKHRVSVLCPGIDLRSVQSVKQARALIQSKGNDDLGFLQMFHLHRRASSLDEFVFHPRVCQAAAELLGSNRVRLYQDCLFIKLPGFSVTNWHSDLNMVPLDTNSFLTFWIPLHSLSQTDSTLHFASASHTDFALPYWQSNRGMDNLERRGYSIETYRELAAGDATVHHGWTLHFAPEQPVSSSSSRLAWTVSYFGDGARLLSTKHARRKVQDEDLVSFGGWFKDVKEGQVVRHKLLPLVYNNGFV